MGFVSLVTGHNHVKLLGVILRSEHSAWVKVEHVTESVKLFELHMLHLLVADSFLEIVYNLVRQFGLDRLVKNFHEAV